MAGEQGKDGKPILAFASPAEWEAWLDAEHAASDGVWVKFAKKGSGVETVVYAEALDVALCYGWIDSQVARLDERFYLQKFTPRRARSKWSQINREKIEELTRQGRMKPAGLEQVELAKADGRWDAAYASPANVEMPDDLQARAGREPEGGRVLGEAEQVEPLRDRLPARGREEAGDASAAPGEVRGDARARREAVLGLHSGPLPRRR